MAATPAAAGALLITAENHGPLGILRKAHAMLTAAHRKSPAAISFTFIVQVCFPDCFTSNWTLVVPR